MPIKLSLCNYCKHLHEGGLTCEAFPDAIPVEVMWGDHRLPYPGDNGIRFEAAPTAPEWVQEWAARQPEEKRVDNLGPRISRVRHALAEIVRQAGPEADGEFSRALRGKKELEELPQKFQEMILRAEKNQ